MSKRLTNGSHTTFSCPAHIGDVVLVEVAHEQTGDEGILTLSVACFRVEMRRDQTTLRGTGIITVFVIMFLTSLTKAEGR